MNVHVPDNIKKKWINFEFQGKPFLLSDGKTYARAYSKHFQVVHFYCFEDDAVYFSRSDFGCLINPTVDKYVKPVIVEGNEV